MAFGKYDKAFSLIEVLIVIVVLSSLALVATINIFEQIKKGVDTRRIGVANNIYSAIMASDVWFPTASAVTLGSTEGKAIIQHLIDTKELEPGFAKLKADDASVIYLTTFQADHTASLCFLPESQSFNSKNSNCNGPTCYACVGEDNASAALLIPNSNIKSPSPSSSSSQSLSLNCIQTNGECQINNSGHSCCGGLVCQEVNAHSGAGKCITQVAPTSTPTPTATSSATPTPTPTPSTSCEEETVQVPFTSGSWGVYSTNTYEGCVNLTMSGVGQSSGTQMSDSFYVYTDSKGVPYQPPLHYPVWYFLGTLCVNGELCINNNAPEIRIPNLKFPNYTDTHIYSFKYCLSGKSKIRFAAGDVFTPDNTGSYMAKIECNGN